MKKTIKLSDVRKLIRQELHEAVQGIKKNLTVPEKHQLKIAKDTLKMSDAGARVMGGMTKEEAREFLRKIGYSDTRIKKMEESKLTESASWDKYMELADLFGRFILGGRLTALNQLKKFKGIQYNQSGVDPKEYNENYTRFVNQLAKLMKNELDWMVEGNRNMRKSSLREGTSSSMWVAFKKLQDRLHKSEFSLRALLSQGKIDDTTFNKLMKKLSSAIEDIEKTAEV